MSVNHDNFLLHSVTDIVLKLAATKFISIPSRIEFEWLLSLVTFDIRTSQVDCNICYIIIHKFMDCKYCVAYRRTRGQETIVKKHQGFYINGIPASNNKVTRLISGASQSKYMVYCDIALIIKFANIAYDVLFDLFIYIYIYIITHVSASWGYVLCGFPLESITHYTFACIYCRWYILLI